jgi:hypothetical protein
MVGSLPQYVSESSTTDNFGTGFEHGPQLRRIKLLIVHRRMVLGLLRVQLIPSDGLQRD